MKKGLFALVTSTFLFAPCVAQQPTAVLVASWEEHGFVPRAFVPKVVLLGANSVSPDLESTVLAQINRERQRLGLKPLMSDETLSLMARAHAAEMARAGVLSHVGADGADTVERARAYGLRGWRMLGENVAFNQGFDDPASFAVERWMRSPRHRANITNALFTHTGIGVVRTPDGRVFFTQLFVAR